MGGACSVWVRGEVYTGFWWGNLRERGHFGDPGIDGEDNIRMALQDVGLWTRLGWLKIGTGGGHM